ncbi:hypothetical protein AB0469_19075 [Streptomyces sp. NPDC093801]|uniref:hypothetical protein n=1 Tax=Streptomyces sp. NPDC093801 TaxID=3155203 RepID=UPI00344EE3A9
MATSTIRTAGQGRALSAASAASSKDSRAADIVASPAVAPAGGHRAWLTRQS